MKLLEGINLIWLRTETRDGSCEHGNEHLGSIKWRAFLG